MRGKRQSKTTQEKVKAIKDALANGIKIPKKPGIYDVSIEGGTYTLYEGAMSANKVKQTFNEQEFNEWRQELTDRDVLTITEFLSMGATKSTMEAGGVIWDEIKNYETKETTITGRYIVEELPNDEDEPITDRIEAHHPIIDVHHPIAIEGKERPVNADGQHKGTIATQSINGDGIQSGLPDVQTRRNVVEVTRCNSDKSTLDDIGISKRQSSNFQAITYDPDVIEFEEVKEEKKTEDVKHKTTPVKPTVIVKPTSGKMSDYGEGWVLGFRR